MTATIDIALRAAGAYMLLTFAFLLLRQAFELRQARFGALMAAGLAFVLIIDTPNADLIPTPLRAIILLFSTNSALFIWWFLRALLDDNFRLGRLEWIVAAAWIAFVIPNYSDFVARRPIAFEFAAWARTAIATGIAIHVIYVAFAGRSSDLVETRRRLRTVLAIVIAALFAFDVAAEFLFGYLNFPILYSAVEAAIWLVVIVWSASWLLRIDKPSLMFAPAPAPAPPAEPVLNPREKAIRAGLDKAMSEDKAFLDPELSIGALAERIGAPEHQLRALINRTMGHRNFRAFLNSYRMAAVKRDLADPGKAGLPILTIAMDSGFASLSAFNRAFKEETGKTPSEWREAAFSAQNTGQN
ncbi:MAG: helix-turn-helix domain-containing protein [Parvularculaceae bacterium]